MHGESNKSSSIGLIYHVADPKGTVRSVLVHVFMHVTSRVSHPTDSSKLAIIHPRHIPDRAKRSDAETRQILDTGS